MKHLDHVRTSDYNSLTDFEKEALLKLIEKSYGFPVIDATKQIDYSYLVVLDGKSKLWSSYATDGYPLLSLEELRTYVAMGMLL